VRGDERQVPELGKRVQELLDAQFTLCTSEVVEVSHAEGDKGAKLLIRLQDGQMVRPPW
jgi:adenine C2-methylase RlmN of 23S rRNA A2503 and tRNA A37